VQKIDRGSRQAIETGDDQNIVLAQVPHQLFELRPAASDARYLLLEQHFAAGLREPAALDFEVLVLGGNTRIAKLHARAPNVVRKLLQKAFLSHTCFAKNLAVLSGIAGLSLISWWKINIFD
jgi:hypothetical protein